MKKQVMLRSAFFNPRGLIGLFIVSAGVFLALLGLGAFSNAYALTPVTDRNPVVRANMHARLLDNRETTPRGGPDPVVVNITLVTGPNTGVSGPSGAAVRIADLDHGLAAGSMKYSYQGINLNDTLAPFLWSKKDGGATLFHIPDDVVLDRSFYLSNGITPDGSKVVGSVIFRDSLTNAPWFATRDGGVEFLAVPENLGGGAVAVSNDGRLIAGIVSSRYTPSQAVVWRDGALETLPTTQTWSDVGSQFPSRPMNSDGSVIVGASGPSYDQMQATKWVDGVEQQLSTGVAAQFSYASFVADNGVIFGTATLSDGRVLPVRWDSGGTSEILEPPSGFGIVAVTSIDTLGIAAGGWVAGPPPITTSHHSCGPSATGSRSSPNLASTITTTVVPSIASLTTGGWLWET